ncbi:MAG: hypothetical protein SFU91_13205 [Chloroherpetonaceae bacterium]|nr:hypothetical protein [Chloroherpetonaceae bacterium]
MKSQLTNSFLKCFAGLPPEIKNLARKNYKLWKENPRHPSLHFKLISNDDSIWSVRIGNNNRVLRLKEDDVITWFWIGSHSDYDKIIKDFS